MEINNCKTKDFCVLSFKTFNGECILNFGKNAKFQYMLLNNDNVQLERKNMVLTIPRESFNRLFITQ